MNLELRAVIGTCYGHHACPSLPVARYCMTNGNAPRLCQEHLDLWLDLADDDEELEPAALVWLWGAAPPVRA